MTAALIERATLCPQVFGLAMAQVQFGGPRGIWLNCTSCNRSDVIVGSNSDEWAKVPTKETAQVFLRHGWTGEGPDLKRARCPRCNNAAVITQQVRMLAAEHLRRDNLREGRDVWDSEAIGEILSGKRDHAPVVQAIADALQLVAL